MARGAGHGPNTARQVGENRHAGSKAGGFITGQTYIVAGGM